MAVAPKIAQGECNASNIPTEATLLWFGTTLMRNRRSKAKKNNRQPSKAAMIRNARSTA
jgi:hypothetical protein